MEENKGDVSSRSVSCSGHGWIAKYTCQLPVNRGSLDDPHFVDQTKSMPRNLTTVFVFQGSAVCWSGLVSKPSVNARVGSCDLGSSSPMWHAQASEKKHFSPFLKIQLQKYINLCFSVPYS